MTASLEKPVSHILFACAGDTQQYDETVSALADVAGTYIARLTRESVRVSSTPGTVKADDVVRALRCDPRTQTHVADVNTDQREFRKI